MLPVGRRKRAATKELSHFSLSLSQRKEKVETGVALSVTHVLEERQINDQRLASPILHVYLWLCVRILVAGR